MNKTTKPKHRYATAESNRALKAIVKQQLFLNNKVSLTHLIGYTVMFN